MATFNKNQVGMLKDWYEVDVIAPIPWPKKLRRNIPEQSNIDGMNIYHPVYWYLPKIAREANGRFFLNSIHREATRLHCKHAYDIVYASWLFPDGWAASRLARNWNVPFFVKVHGSDVNLLQAGTEIANKSLEVVASAEKVICVSNSLKERLVDLGAGPEKLTVLYNGIDHRVFHPISQKKARKDLGLDEERRIILFVGNLKKEKGLGELAEAFKLLKKEVPNALLAVIGTGPFARTFRKSLDRSGCLKETVFAGNLPAGQVAQWMNAADVVCLPSYMEGIPNVVLEALACGKPVLATEVGGLPEVRSRVSEGLELVPPRNHMALFPGLLRLLNGRVECAGAGINSWQENVAELRDLFNLALTGASGGLADQSGNPAGCGAIA
jgi:glycosyltransferase involved in cell wall biosynthesis